MKAALLVTLVFIVSFTYRLKAQLADCEGVKLTKNNQHRIIQWNSSIESVFNILLWRYGYAGIECDSSAASEYGIYGYKTLEKQRNKDWHEQVFWVHKKYGLQRYDFTLSQYIQETKTGYNQVSKSCSAVFDFYFPKADSTWQPDRQQDFHQRSFRLPCVSKQRYVQVRQDLEVFEIAKKNYILRTVSVQETQ